MKCLPKPNTVILWIFLFCFLLPLTSYLQTTSENNVLSRNMRHHVEERYKIDDLLVNGILYHPENTNAEGSPYFLNDKVWKVGTLYIKGRTFTNQNILYDIELDRIITNIIYPDGLVKNIIINTDMIDSLVIADRFFVNASIYSLEKMNGLHEQVYKGKFSALIKHHKTFNKKFTYETPNGYFSNPTSTLIILSDNSLLKINNKKALLEFFKSNKKRISKYIRNNNLRLKTANSYELSNLFKFCDDLTN